MTFWKRLRVIFRMKTSDALSNRLREVGRQRGAVDLFLVEQTTQVSGLRPENGSCATLAGLLLEKFGRIPTAGESITFSGLRFDVVKATRSRIERVRISRTDAH